MNTLSLLPQEKLHGDIYKGQEIWVDNIKITVMNKPYLQSYNSINNSSVAYMLDINGKKALFLGDMGAETGKQFIEDPAGIINVRYPPNGSPRPERRRPGSIPGAPPGNLPVARAGMAVE